MGGFFARIDGPADGELIEVLDQRLHLAELGLSHLLAEIKGDIVRCDIVRDFLVQ